VVDLLRATSKLAFPSIILYSGTSGHRRRPTLHKRRRISWRLDSGRVAKLCADYQAGLTTRELAEQYDIGKTAVTRLLREQHIPLRHQGLSAEQTARAVSRYEAGRSVAQVAAEMELPTNSVYDALNRAGTAMRDRHERIRHEDDAAAVGGSRTPCTGSTKYQGGSGGRDAQRYP